MSAIMRVVFSGCLGGWEMEFRYTNPSGDDVVVEAGRARNCDAQRSLLERCAQTRHLYAVAGIFLNQMNHSFMKPSPRLRCRRCVRCKLERSFFDCAGPRTATRFQ